jgi:hypothetical protein
MRKYGEKNVLAAVKIICCSLYASIAITAKRISVLMAHHAADGIDSSAIIFQEK